ncbi:GNAT family N-acetyltransferase [Blastococcus sp. SYSU D00820]
MTGGPLVHLVEPADWRAALSAGELRPPSLAAAGFVHLSTPAQVHLPAQRLYPGRRDLALLVVDPARLTGPVRWEPGVPGDPDGERFPHLYGPLPTSAVVAVVPWRPPVEPVLPAPGDRLGRTLAALWSLPVRRAPEVRDVPGGVAVVDRRFPHSRDDNRLLLTAPVGTDDAARAEVVAATAGEVAADAGWVVRAAALCWPGADAVAAELRTRGWRAEELLLMAGPARPLPGGEPAEIVEQREVHPLWDRTWRQELPPHLPDLDEVVAQLIAREHRADQVAAVTDVAVREAGQVVAAGQLRVDGATATVESVMTDPVARGRGHARAVLARLVTLAAEAGCDLVALEADAQDWPRHWYARHGFAVVGSLWDVAAPALPQAGATQESSR